MGDQRVFNDSVFRSYTNLKTFFIQSDDVKQVLEHKNDTFSTPLNPLNPKLAGKWQVCQVASAPFRWILAIVLEAIAGIAALFGADQFSKKLSDYAAHIKIGFNVFSQEETHLFQIADSINSPNKDGKKVNYSQPIPETQITDLRVKRRTFCNVDNEIRFGHHQGICRGESYWFLYLYHQTKNQFSDPRAHMAALGKIFENGGGMDPTLLQSIHLKKGKLLNLKIGTQPAHSRGQTVTSLIKKRPEEWRDAGPDLINRLQNLPSGAYATGLPLHQTAYVKISPTLSFFFDPNHGVIEINGSEQGKKLHKLMLETLNATGETSKTYPNLLLHMDVVPVSQRT